MLALLARGRKSKRARPTRTFRSRYNSMDTTMSSPTPTITLAGREWPLPKLATRQNRIVVPALLQLVPKILSARDAADKAGEKGSFAALARYLDTGCYDTLASLVFAALTRASPQLARDAFDDMAIDTFELLAAVVPIARAAGLVRTETPSPARSAGKSLPRTRCGVASPGLDPARDGGGS
jgi:hypothetical protein